MIIIRFPDAATERKGLGYLAKRFPLTTWATGETAVSQVAIDALVAAGIPFSIQGSTTYEAGAPSLRGTPANTVQ